MNPKLDNMRRTLYRWIAAINGLAVSLFLLAPASHLHAARRPRYGGTLRIETAASFQAADTSEPRLVGPVFETLVRLDERGDPHPGLAISWTHDAAHKQWRFTPRPNVLLQNGAPWQPSPDFLSFPDDRPIDRILVDLARPRNAVVIRTADGVLVGTGPFAVAHFEPGKSLVLSAHNAYWGGRPYLDSIEIVMGQSLRQQTLDLELGKADVIDADVAQLRRLRQENANVAVSSPIEVLSLVFDGVPAAPDAEQEAVALSIDRSAIQTVLLQRQGQISGSLLPQWLSGYGFVFPVARDLARARQLGAGLPAIAIGYDKNDPLLRAIAERISVNASETGLSVRAVADSPANGRVIRLRITSTDRMTALDDLAEQLKTPFPPSPATLYDAERGLLHDAHVIPLVDVPEAWQLSPKVHGWSTAGRWPVPWQDTWVEP
jgi:peptide/nickel transport system substrate-binding protein